jgi:hypothetical protein
MATGKRNAWRHTELEVIQTLKRLGTGSSHDIAKAMGLGHKWVGQKLAVLKAAGRIYISGYIKIAVVGPHRELYSLRIADEEDEPKPVPMTMVQKTRLYRSRLKQKELLNVTSGRKSSSNLSR